MKNFKGPKSCGGWVGIIMSVVGSFAKSEAEKKKDKDGEKLLYKDKSDLGNLQFQQQSWLDQQSEKWKRQDTQTGLNYKENAIAGFADAAPANAESSDGSWGPRPTPTKIDTTGLAQTQGNGAALIYDPRTGKPVNNNAQVPSAPLSQFG